MAKNVVLALGGGGVRGIAHLGVVQCLLDNDYEIVGIAGTSAGGLFGAPLAAQVPTRDILAEVIEFFKSPNFRRTPSDPPSLLGTTGIERVLTKFIEGKTFKDLPIKFAVTAVSFKTGKEVVITEGDVMKAVLATISIPGVSRPGGRCAGGWRCSGPSPSQTSASIEPLSPNNCSAASYQASWPFSYAD